MASRTASAGGCWRPVWRSTARASNARRESRATVRAVWERVRRGDQPHGARPPRAVRADRRHHLHGVGRTGRRRAPRAELRERRGDPQRVSIGLMQTLISTAREAMQATRRPRLAPPGRQLDRGRHRLHRRPGQAHGPRSPARRRRVQRRPPQASGQRREQVEAAAVSDRHRQALRPLRTLPQRCRRRALQRLTATGPVPQGPRRRRGPAARSTPTATAAESSPEVAFAERAVAEDVTPYSLGVLRDILRTSKLKRVLVSSTSRSPKDQARVMYDNCERHGAESQKGLYAAAGDKVIDVYIAAKRAGKTPDQTKLAMEEKVSELGPPRSRGTPPIRGSSTSSTSRRARSPTAMASSRRCAATHASPSS